MEEGFELGLTSLRACPVWQWARTFVSSYLDVQGQDMPLRDSNLPSFSQEPSFPYFPFCVAFFLQIPSDDDVCVCFQGGRHKGQEQSPRFPVFLTLPSCPFLSPSIPSCHPPPSVPSWPPSCTFFFSSLPLPSPHFTPLPPGPSPFPSFPVYTFPSPLLSSPPSSCNPSPALPFISSLFLFPSFLATHLTLRLSPQVRGGLTLLAGTSEQAAPPPWPCGAGAAGREASGGPAGVPDPSPTGLSVGLTWRKVQRRSWVGEEGRWKGSAYLDSGTSPWPVSSAREWLSQEHTTDPRNHVAARM